MATEKDKGMGKQETKQEREGMQERRQGQQQQERGSERQQQGGGEQRRGSQQQQEDGQRQQRHGGQQGRIRSIATADVLQWFIQRRMEAISLSTSIGSDRDRTGSAAGAHSP